MNQKITVNRIELKNFMSFGNKWQYFKPKGMSFITGLNTNNDRRNFTGKTTLLRVIPFALFGSIQGIKKELLPNWKNKKNLETKIDISKGQDVYTIHRGIKPDFLYVYKNDEQLPEPSNKKDFQKQIESEILEFSQEFFLYTVFADTKNSPSIFSLSKPKKRELLEQIFNLEYFTQIKDKANKKISEKQSDIKEKEIEINNLNSNLEEYKTQYTKFHNELKNINDSNSLLEQKKKEIEESDSEQLDNKINGLESKLQETKKEYDKLENVENKLKLKINFIKRNYLSKDIKDNSGNIISLERRISSINNEIEQLKSSLVEVKEGYDEDRKKQYEQQISEYKAQIKTKQKEVDKIQNELRNKPTEGECPVCFQVVNYDKIKSYITEQTKKLNDQISNITTSLEKSEKEYSILEQIEQNIKQNEKIQKEIDKKENELEKIKIELDKITEEQMSLYKQKKYKSVLDKLSSVISDISSQKSNINKNMSVFEEDILELNNQKQKITELYNQIDRLNSQVEQEERERKRIKEWIEDNIEKKKQTEKDIEERNKFITKTKNIIDYLQVIKNLTSDEEAKQYTISNKIPLLNKKVNYYLSKTDVNYYVKLDSWLDVEFRGPGINKCSYENLSGAEKLSLDLSMRLALIDINKMQSPTYLNMFIADELIDSSLDSKGIHNAMNILKTLNDEQETDTLIVSHRSEIDELDHYFDSKYCVEYDRYSKIKEK